jgi:hypothetical protein
MIPYLDVFRQPKVWNPEIIVYRCADRKTVGELRGKVGFKPNLNSQTGFSLTYKMHLKILRLSVGLILSNRKLGRREAVLH